MKTRVKISTLFIAALAVGCGAEADTSEADLLAELESQEIVENLKMAGFPEEEIDMLEVWAPGFE